MATIDTSVEVEFEVDHFIDEASDLALIEELNSRNVGTLVETPTIDEQMKLKDILEVGLFNLNTEDLRVFLQSQL